MPLNPLNHHYAIEHQATVYDEEAMTALELAGKTTGKVNETVEAFNKLEAETNNHLDTQDQLIDDRLEAQDEKLTRMETVQIPQTVKDEVTAHIAGGDFDTAIDKYAGNLETRMDNLLGSMVTGSTTGDAELIDGRTGATGKAYANVGEHIRDISDKAVITPVFEKWVGYYISGSGAIIKSEAFSISNRIPVVPGETIIVDTLVSNEYISQVSFSKIKELATNQPVGATALVISSADQTGRHVLTVPEGYTSMWVSIQNDKAKPQIFRVVPEICDNLCDYLTKKELGVGGAPVELVFADNVGKYYSAGGAWYYREDLNFSVSNAIPVVPGEVYSMMFDQGNEYLQSVIFQNTPTPENGAVVKGYIIATAGTYSIIVPDGAKYMFVGNDQPAGGAMGYTIPTVIKTLTNIFNEVKAITSSAQGTLQVSLPESYSLVVGDTFELFYKGIIQAKDPYIYDIEVACDMGKSMGRKYMVTPTADHIGDHALTVIVRDNNGATMGTASTKLVVKNKATAPNTQKNILCVGDSLTAGGQWVGEAKRRLTSTSGTPAGDGLNRVAFIGKKTVNGASFEATGGWRITHYNMADEAKNPFYNASAGKVDFQSYVSACGASSLELCIILLGWNSTHNTEEEYKAELRTFIGNLRADYPGVEVLLFGIQVPDIDGLGTNYGCDWNYMDKIRDVFEFNLWLENVASEYTGVRFVNVAGQFDTDYNMPKISAPVNVRNTTTEIIGNNGVHPDTPGYYQIADVAYREITHYLQEV